MDKIQGRIKVCSKCYVCMYDCCQTVEIPNCNNFTKGYTVEEYKKFIHQYNLNLKKMCNSHGLCLNTLYKMLKYKYPMTYKYKYILNLYINENPNYLPYIEKFKTGGING